MNAKRVTQAVALAFAAWTSGAAQATVTFDWASIGNVRNAPDPLTGKGAVFHEYLISKHEVTNAQYVVFLNAVAASDPTGLYNPAMSTSHAGGINRSGEAGSYTYSARAGREQNPVTYVSWYDAARFSNWLTNGQGSGSTEFGVYRFISDDEIDDINRDLSNPDQVFIPTENEWYKAAYHDASAGYEGQYFRYATGTNDEPYSDNPNSLNTPDDSNVANFRKDDNVDNGYDDGFAVSGNLRSPGSPENPNLLTDAGAYKDAASPYGTYDQNGNVREFTETVVVGRSVMRGGTYRSPSGHLQSTTSQDTTLSRDDEDLGFRLARPAVKGDLNGDNRLTNGDISAFVLALTNEEEYAVTYSTIDPQARGDYTGNGSLTNGDISGFVDALTGGLETVAAPEPSSLSLLAISGLFLFQRRR